MKSSDLLKCVARAFVKYGGNVVGGGIAGNLAIDIWDTWEKSKKSEAEKKAELEQLAQEPATKLNEEVKQVIQEIAPNQSPEVKQALKDYLNQVPAMVRRSLKGPGESQGLRVPAHMTMSKAEDLAWLLPDKLPQFKPGQKPLPGVDLQLIDLLGVGGFGEVWKAKNPVLPNTRPVALKFCLDATAAASLRHEAAMLDRVMKLGKEPGIIRLQHTYLSATPPCLEYEYVAGGDLVGVIHDWHHGKEGVTAKHIARVVARLARIVGVAHAGGIVHRDLKPANILVQKYADGKLHLKIADFGIGGMASNVALKETQRGAKDVTQSTAVRGAYTPLYASPQQMRGDAPDPRDDVYALGVIWYQMLLGNLSVGAPTGRAWQKKLTDGGVTSAMLKLLESCFEQELDSRPANAGVLADRLETLLGPPTAAEIAASSVAFAPPGKATAPARKKRRVLPLLAGVLLLAVAGVGAVVVFKPELLPPSITNLFKGKSNEADLVKVQLVIDTPLATQVTVKQKGTLVTRAQSLEVPLPPGDYEIELTGNKPGVRPAREVVTLHPYDKEIHLGGWQAEHVWKADALREGKVAAPTLPANVTPLLDESFAEPVKGKKGKVPEAPPKKGADFGFASGKFFILVKGEQYVARPLAKDVPYTDFACQLDGHASGDAATEWGITLAPEKDDKKVDENAAIAILLNRKGEMQVRPAREGKLSGFQVGPFSHPAIKPGTVTNKLLFVLRGKHLELYVNGVAVCDPITLPRTMGPTHLRLAAQAHGQSGTAEFEHLRVISAAGVSTPEARGAVAAR